MTLQFAEEIEKLKKMILELGARVEANLNRAVQSLERKDVRLADEVIQLDDEIDRAEVVLEEECLKILALHQPVAIDLRFIVSCLKINNDLERIGDLAVNIAERAQLLAREDTIPAISMDLAGMAEKTQDMLRRSLDALVNMDSGVAESVRDSDDEVDDMNRQMYDEVKQGIKSDPEHVNALIHYLSASRQLERIADHATNIAKDIIYMIDGKIVRHRASIDNA
jgi:phosphate transport system protein